jgi:hypothetical protein
MRDCADFLMSPDAIFADKVLKIKSQPEDSMEMHSKRPIKI